MEQLQCRRRATSKGTISNCCDKSEAKEKQNGGGSGRGETGEEGSASISARVAVEKVGACAGMANGETAEKTEVVEGQSKLRIGWSIFSFGF